eukprot:gnl/Hemi2/25346_TR8536_c0_g1_i3.p1 gnl/Hemi2/25346_TR8536_c0_g1~~gnl/Hemi2/25346_TR8536_c0_g1_i3.p1  ORF type:complete len:248 (+),score=61.48 gnl/Hemi2/25346_TR8536_c0_g1_i3:126-869(+)
MSDSFYRNRYLDYISRPLSASRYCSDFYRGYYRAAAAAAHASLPRSKHIDLSYLPSSTRRYLSSDYLLSKPATSYEARLSALRSDALDRGLHSLADTYGSQLALERAECESRALAGHHWALGALRDSYQPLETTAEVASRASMQAARLARKNARLQSQLVYQEEALRRLNRSVTTANNELALHRLRNNLSGPRSLLAYDDSHLGYYRYPLYDAKPFDLDIFSNRSRMLDSLSLDAYDRKRRWNRLYV